MKIALRGLLVAVLLAGVAATPTQAQPPPGALTRAVVNYWAARGYTQLVPECGGRMSWESVVPTMSQSNGIIIGGWATIDDAGCRITLGNSNPVMLCRVAVHEYGHLLGLPHTDGLDNIM